MGHWIHDRSYFENLANTKSKILKNTPYSRIYGDETLNLKAANSTNEPVEGVI